MRKMFAPISLPKDITNPLPHPKSGVLVYEGKEYPLDYKSMSKSKKHIGQGSQGKVTLARFETLDLPMALKTIELKSFEDYKDDVKEGERLMQLSHPNVVKCYGHYFGKRGNKIKIAFEYMSLKGLDNIIKARGRFPEPILSYVARQILSGLDYVHKLKLYHRDIKPQNILVNEAGEVKLADFGTSKQLDRTNEPTKTGIGTYKYFAPERLEGKNYKKEIDIWAFGFVIYECAVGKFPIDVKYEMSYLVFKEKIMSIDPKHLVSDLSPILKSFLSKCLKSNPDKRYSAEKLLSMPFIKEYRNVGPAEFKTWLKTSRS